MVIQGLKTWVLLPWYHGMALVVLFFFVGSMRQTRLPFISCGIGAMTSIASSAVVFEGLFTDISRFHGAYLLLGLSWCLWCSSWSNEALPRIPQRMFLQDASCLSLPVVACVQEQVGWASWWNGYGHGDGFG